MRVLHCIWRMGNGGAERQLIHLSSALRDRGIEVHTAVAFDGDNDDALRASGTELHRLQARHKFDARIPFRLAGLFRRIRPDILNTWLTQMDILAGLAAEVRGLPWVLSERSTAEAYPPSIVHRVRAATGRRADVVVANSPGGARYWAETAQRTDPIHVIPNIVPFDSIDAAIPIESAALGVGMDEEVVLFAGRFSEEKNLESLLRAVAPVLRVRAAKIVFCGDGSQRPAMEQVAAQLGILPRIVFAGWSSNVWSWMKRADVVISLSRFEGNPNAVLEAMACRAPLILSDIEGHRTVLQAGEAVFVDPADPVAVAAALTDLLENKERARNMGALGRVRVASRSASLIAGQYEQAYRAAVMNSDLRNSRRGQ